VAKKYILEVEEDYDFEVYGLASHERNYRVCWEINVLANINLALKPGCVFNRVNGALIEHIVYLYENEDLGCRIHLICNQQGDSILFPKHKNLSYLLKVENYPSENLNKLLQLLKPSSIILTVFKLDLETLKFRDKLIF